MDIRCIQISIVHSTNKQKKAIILNLIVDEFDSRHEKLLLSPICFKTHCICINILVAI